MSMVWFSPVCIFSKAWFAGIKVSVICSTIVWRICSPSILPRGKADSVKTECATDLQLSEQLYLNVSNVCFSEATATYKWTHSGSNAMLITKLCRCKFWSRSAWPCFVSRHCHPDSNTRQNHRLQMTLDCSTPVPNLFYHWFSENYNEF